ncbi:hypothetical protein AO501_29075 [Mycobacterium gordonae]|uniref:DUF2231 domain-containing protein n=1 Tax=Mycobacterium gordonae TaxID=1778 RepID=A0A0Q2M8T8_MYCGO|nr:DUF2231 domain-containing protein [Mycobacterium gordonae]KQH76279.1 hypothetical protein AO501_29075 [Mycobacterium gordonae]
MSTFRGLPVHPLLTHFIVVLIPLTALLAVICVLWPAARRRLVWLVLALSVVTAVVTPVTISSGRWLQHQVGGSPSLSSHAALGATMTYFSWALLMAAVVLAALHLCQARGIAVKPLAQWLIAALVIAAAGASAFQVYRIGDTGAQAVWGGTGHGCPMCTMGC